MERARVLIFKLPSVWPFVPAKLTQLRWDRYAHQVPITCHVAPGTFRVYHLVQSFCSPMGRHPHYTDGKLKAREVKPMGPGHTVAERWSRLQTQRLPELHKGSQLEAGLLVYDAWPCWGGEGRGGGWLR